MTGAKTTARLCGKLISIRHKHCFEARMFERSEKTLLVSSLGLKLSLATPSSLSLSSMSSHSKAVAGGDSGIDSKRNLSQP